MQRGEKMRVKDKAQFVLGITDIIMSIALSVITIIQHKEDKLIVTVFVLFCGMMALSNGIETKKQRKRKEEEYKQMIAFWYGEDDEENG